MKSGPLTVGIADIRRRPGQHRDEHLEAVLEELAVLGSHVPQGSAVVLDLRLESLNDGIVAKGTVRAPWQGECRRCLRPIESMLETEVLEIFEESPVEGETRLLDGAHIDLEPVARETVLLELPLAPLCREECAGLCPECGADRNDEDCGHALVVHDARWTALDHIRFDN